MIASEITTQALRVLGVLAIGETARAEDSTTALEYLNDMLAEWHVDEVGLPEYSAETLSSELNIGREDKTAIALQLAVRLAPEYGMTLGPDVLSRAESSMEALRKRYFAIAPADYSHLPGVRNGCSE